jgi:hypothetical protein
MSPKNRNSPAVNPFAYKVPMLPTGIGLLIGCGIFLMAIVIALFAATGAKLKSPANTVSSNRPNTTVGQLPTRLQEADAAPRLGNITIGAFAPEAVPDSKMSLEALDNDAAYSLYRSAVQSTYGADLADMNYLGVGMRGWQVRYSSFGHWLQRASKYGDPTIAIEPIGPTGYGIFADNEEMRALRGVFDTANKSGTIVWVRFASESNLRFSRYSVYDNQAQMIAYRKSVRWFRKYMPSNVRLVFSPLINTAYLQDPRQIRTLVSMYEPGAYDRIGGTLYATSWLRPRAAFDWYYHFMRQRDATTPFQICELGGTYPRSDEVKAFLVRVARGDWPGVQRVNLFAGDLNSLATSQHGHFGFILPGANTSYIADLFSGNSSSPVYQALTTDRQLALMEQIGAGWKSVNMTVGGSIVRILHGRSQVEIEVQYVTDELGDRSPLRPARPKRVIITPECTGANLLDSARAGDAIEVTGWDSGTGTPLRASEISADAAN